MLNYLIAILATLILSSCGETKVQKDLLASARDPDSVKFGDELIKEGSALECSTVNGKNGFGGYTGPHWYMHYYGTTVVASTDEESATIERCCRFVQSLKGAGTSPFNSPDFSRECRGMPGGLDLTKTL